MHVNVSISYWNFGMHQIFNMSTGIIFVTELGPAGCGREQGLHRVKLIKGWSPGKLISREMILPGYAWFNSYCYHPPLPGRKKEAISHKIYNNLQKTHMANTKVKKHSLFLFLTCISLAFNAPLLCFFQIQVLTYKLKGFPSIEVR